VRARSLPEAERLLAPVEREAIALGVPAANARGSTTAIAQHLAGELPPPASFPLHPQALLEQLVREGRSGATRANLSASLLDLHLRLDR
jgi:hypothetical protein